MDTAEKAQQELEGIEKQIPATRNHQPAITVWPNKTWSSFAPRCRPCAHRSRATWGPGIGPNSRGTRSGRTRSTSSSILFTDFSELHGDRRFADDPAIVCGMARFEGRAVMVIGQQKGRDTKQKLYRNFGMPKPEGYRKALRVMHLAAKFARPSSPFWTRRAPIPGSTPRSAAKPRPSPATCGKCRGCGADHRGLTGEGGSGGALALGVGNRVLMLENAVYRVISPESCAAIIWRDSTKPNGSGGLQTNRRGTSKTGSDRRHRARAGRGSPPRSRRRLRPAGYGATAAPGAVARRAPAGTGERRYQKFRAMTQFFEDGTGGGQ